MKFLLIYFDNYFFLIFYIFFSIIICLILSILSVLLRYLSFSKTEGDLSSAYECGFLPFDRARNRFEVKFFMVSILFVLFDLEVIFILPWTVALQEFTLPSFLLMVYFLVVLIVTFVFEIVENALDF